MIRLFAAVLAAVLLLSLSAVPAAAEERRTMYVSAATFADGDGQTHPVLHTSPGGVGTFEDPVTVSVGSVKTLGAVYLHISAGRRVYLPHLRRYGIVEDTYGRGQSVRVYVAGRSLGVQAAESCAANVSGRHPVIVDPGPGYPTEPGPIADLLCRTYGDTVPKPTAVTTPRSMPTPFSGGIRHATSSAKASTSSTPSSPTRTEDAPAQPGFGWLVRLVDWIEGWLR